MSAVKHLSLIVPFLCLLLFLSYISPTFPQAGPFFVKRSVWHELLPYAFRLAKKYSELLFSCAKYLAICLSL